MTDSAALPVRRNPADRSVTRAERLSMPLARDVVEQLAVRYGVCIRPVPIRRIDLVAGGSEVIDVPCGATLDSKCPSCAKRNRYLRMAQCREGWHLDHEPVAEPPPADDYQCHLVEVRADAQALHDRALAEGRTEDAENYAGAIAELDAEINDAGMRGTVTGRSAPKRNRSTRRRQDAPDLPKRHMRATTLGRTFTGRDGKTFRPSMFLTLTLPSYGKVKNGAPVDPESYDYAAAARDALHFSKLIDRFVQNLRRVAGFEVQYFATVEPQKRLAPHLHMAIRGTLPRAEIKAIAAATYHQVWWPPVDQAVYSGDRLPVWEDGAGYLDPDTGEVLPTWEEALDRLDADQDAEPLHVVRFGEQVDAQGILAGTPDADQAIRYLSKYLTKSLGEPLDPSVPGAQARAEHAARLVEALRYEPCSPACPNWLRYGVQPKGARSGMAPGRCRSKAHKPEHLGYAGRRVLVSRKWSGKTLAEHKADRRAWALAALGLDENEQRAERERYTWRPVPAGDANLPPLTVRLLRGVAERQRRHAELLRLEAAATGRPPQDLSATGIGEAA